MNKLENPRIRSRKLWDKHGSTLILVVAALLSFNAGSEWRAYQCRQVLVKLIDTSLEERNDLRGRLREYSRLNRELSAQLGPTAVQAAEAAANAAQAVDKASTVLEKANETIDKAGQILEQAK